VSAMSVSAVGVWLYVGSGTTWCHSACVFCDPVVTLIPIAVTEDANDHLLAPTTAMADVMALVMYGHKDQSLCLAPNNCEKKSAAE
jgi:hypothetical protein